MSLRRIFKFAKPKNPGFGISKSFYLSVLAGHAQLPSPDEIANPQQARGAVEGFLAPLMEGSQKDDLQKPLQRGVYALASRDRKTVLKLMVVNKEEAGFDTEAIVRSQIVGQLSPEAVARVRATWTLLQLTFETHDAMVAPALAFLYRAVKRMAELTEGVVADPVSQRYMLPGELPEIAPGRPLEAPDHVLVRLLAQGDRVHAYTLGMQKFGLSEFELQEIENADVASAEAFLLSLCQTRLAGGDIQIGDRVGARRAFFDVAPGGLESTLWHGIPCLELLPSRGNTAAECLAAWLAEQVP